MVALFFKSVKRYGIVRKKLCKNAKTSVDLSRLLHSTPYCSYACLAPNIFCWCSFKLQGYAELHCRQERLSRRAAIPKLQTTEIN